MSEPSAWDQALTYDSVDYLVTFSVAPDDASTRLLRIRCADGATMRPDKLIGAIRAWADVIEPPP